MIYLKNKSDTEKVTSGNYDHLISQFKNYYELVRKDYESLGAGVIGISTYWFETDGKVDSSSAYLSVQVLDGKNDQLALSKGMDVKKIGNRVYYQYVVRAPFSRAAKKAILAKLYTELSTMYPDDLFKLDEKIPLLSSMVNTKRIMQMLNNCS